MAAAFREGYYVDATCVVDLSWHFPDDSGLWRVLEIPYDENDRIIPGTTTIVGPDGKAWTHTANPNFYDDEIVETALYLLYFEGLADLVDPEALFERVEAITTQRNHAIYALPDAARRGDLRKAPEEDRHNTST